MKLHQKFGLILSTISLLSFMSYANAETKVIASIKPLHSLVSYVMDGVGTPGILVDGSSSPHTFQLKPSHATMLQEADIVFWIGEDLESFLETPLESIAANSRHITLMESDEIELLKFREKNIFGGHDDHDDHGDEHDEHADEHGDEHDEHDEHADEHGDEHDDHHDGHAHGEHDIHFWLDPEIAKTIVKIVTRELSEIDPSNASTYESNSTKAINEIDQLISDTKSKINSNASYVVFHDAYQYFEKRFGVEVVGALTVNPEVLPGAKQLSEIREVIEHENINCLFSEPQFNPSIAETIAKDTGVKAAVIDPLGAELNPGKDLYFDLIGNIASSFESC
ncbi:zinc ABC transporter substrate-binding protein ZnuA [Pelagibacteraceae bacterium]|nr:zinc ABC transporter substrate-binding protein ZnuA [Pelagibacteraceae bacterium]